MFRIRIQNLIVNVSQNEAFRGRTPKKIHSGSKDQQRKFRPPNVQERQWGQEARV